MKKIPAWFLIVVMISLLLAAFFAAGQAIAMAWLSALQGQASQIESLELRFWSYVAISAVLLIVDLGLLVHTIRRRRKEGAA
jgi:hypothetical protein